MKIAIAQIVSLKANIDFNIKHHCTFINEAVNDQADIIIFPELSITGYQLTLAAELATDGQDDRFNIFQTLADEHHITIAIGAPIKTKGKPYIGMIVFCPNDIPHLYLKKYLHSSEQPYFASGENKSVLLSNHPQISLAICYECSVAKHWQ